MNNAACVKRAPFSQSFNSLLVHLFSLERSCSDALGNSKQMKAERRLPFRCGGQELITNTQHLLLSVLTWSGPKRDVSKAFMQTPNEDYSVFSGAKHVVLV